MLVIPNEKFKIIGYPVHPDVFRFLDENGYKWNDGVRLVDFMNSDMNFLYCDPKDKTVTYSVYDVIPERRKTFNFSARSFNREVNDVESQSTNINEVLSLLSLGEIIELTNETMVVGKGVEWVNDPLVVRLYANTFEYFCNTEFRWKSLDKEHFHKFNNPYKVVERYKEVLWLLVNLDDNETVDRIWVDDCQIIESNPDAQALRTMKTRVTHR